MVDMEQRLRIIYKEGKRWKAEHSDGAITYHKTLKAAKEYEHSILVFDPFAEDMKQFYQP